VQIIYRIVSYRISVYIVTHNALPMSGSSSADQHHVRQIHHKKLLVGYFTICDSGVTMLTCDDSEVIAAVLLHVVSQSVAAAVGKARYKNRRTSFMHVRPIHQTC